MNIREKDIDLIEKYLEGNLTGTEYQEFKDRLEHDQELKSSLQEMETIVTGIRYTGRRKIQQELQQLEASLPKLRQEKDTKVISMKRFRTWAAAASIVLVALSAIWILNKNQVNEDRLFSTYYQPYPNVESPTTRSAAELTPRQQAYYAYDLENYADAASLFDNISPENKKDIDDFYQAISHLSNQDPLMAEKVLTGYIQSGDDIMQGKAQWYLALTKLQLGKTDECKEILNLIIDQESYNFKKAARLLEDLL